MVRWTSLSIRTMLIYVVLIAFLLVSILPIFWMVLAAFKDPQDLNQDPFSWPARWTWENFREAWTVGKMGQYFINSVIVAVPRVTVILILSSLAGYAFGKLRFPGRDALFYFFLFGMTVPIQAMIIPLYYQIQSLNLINTYWSMILPSFGLSMPFAVFMMRAFFRDLPNELLDAAQIDGCNNWTAFLYVMLPLMRPAITCLLVFEFIWSWNDFLLPLLFVYDDAYRTLPLGLMYFFGEYTVNQSLVAAGVAITILPMIAMYLIFHRKLLEGITAGSLKG